MTPYEIVQEQAEDEGLWFFARTAPEGYLQQELRRLHAAIEATDGALRKAIDAELALVKTVANPFDMGAAAAYHWVLSLLAGDTLATTSDGCAECARQERLLGADPTEEWVADEWGRALPHPHEAGDKAEPPRHE